MRAGHSIKFRPLKGVHDRQGPILHTHFPRPERENDFRISCIGVLERFPWVVHDLQGNDSFSIRGFETSD